MIKKLPYKRSELSRSGKLRKFTGSSLAQVAMPIGGLGTGTVSLGGRGNLQDWEIFNRPGKGQKLLYTFPAIFTRTASGKTCARVLERRLLPPFVEDAGLEPHDMCGLPRLEEAKFTAKYPSGEIEFSDKSLPVRVKLTAFNPMVPLDEDSSGIPAAILVYELANRTNEEVEASVAWSMMNACGYNNSSGWIWKRLPAFGAQQNVFRADEGLRGIHMTTEKYGPRDLRYGTMALTTLNEETSHLAHWPRTGWWDDGQYFWDDFSTDGRFEPSALSEPSEERHATFSSLAAIEKIPPGGKAKIVFVVSWHMPLRDNYWSREEELKGAVLRNKYADRFEDAWDAAAYTAKNIDRLTELTEKFTDALYGSTLPSVAVDAAGSNMSIMRTQTGMWLDNDRYYGFEGCMKNTGSCPMNCTHVYNYEHALAWLYPRLERTMRLTDFNENMLTTGKMAFRTFLPHGRVKWKAQGAADGQMGTVVQLYREYLLSGDLDFLKSQYSAAKKAVKYALKEWDKDADGVMEGVQHNTYDIEFHGPNTMTGSVYLAALMAISKMAKALGKKTDAAEFEKLYKAGKRKYEKKLFSGEYFVQDVEITDELRYQYGYGCLSDQMLGEWLAESAGLGHVFSPEKVKSAYESIFKYNWHADLTDHASVQRVYALNDEAGLTLCSWPHGQRPKFPFPYSDEVWTGVEYSVAAGLISNGYFYEGLAVVKGVRDRHDGVKRNPFDEFEYGHHYTRAMASWTLINALSGFTCDNSTGHIGFIPKTDTSRFSTFFSTGTAWGTYSRKNEHKTTVHVIKVLFGCMNIASFMLSACHKTRHEMLSIVINDTVKTGVLDVKDDKVLVTPNNEIALVEGDTLTIELGEA